MKRTRRLVVATAISFTILAAWTACSSFDATEATPDAGGSVEASAGDADLTDADLTDAGLTDARSGGPGCVPDAHTFCDDFEQDPRTSKKWAMTVRGSGGIEQSTEEFVSGTHSVLITMGADAGPTEIASLGVGFGPSRAVRCDWSIYPVLLPVNAERLVVVVVQPVPGLSPQGRFDSTLRISRSGATLSVWEQRAADGVIVVAGQKGEPVGALLQPGRWHRIHYELVLQTPEITVRVDDAGPFAYDPPIPADTNQGVGITLGALSASGDGDDSPGESRFFVDDFACDLDME
jgi:hypothetical protein